ncbi:MAG: Ig-like domain-containing protein [Mangrovibacterium sp.]
MIRLRYIWTLMLLAATLVVAGQNYVIDEVCIGSRATYRIDGEEGSTYSWMLTDEYGTVIQNNIPSTLITGVDPVTGAPNTSSEVQISWNMPGTYLLSAVQTSLFNCDSLQLGEVIVYISPTAYAGPPQVICPGEEVILYGATASNYNNLLWETSGDGQFDDPDQLNPEYRPGVNDLALGFVNLTLTAEGLGRADACTPAVSSVNIILIDADELVSITDSTVCEIDLPLAWNGDLIDRAGTYTADLISIHGCDSTAILNLTVLPDNVVPVAVDDRYVIQQGVINTFDVLANDSDPNGELDPTTLHISTPPAHGTISLNGNFEVVYTPDPDYTGEDSFGYTVCDDGIPCHVLCDFANVTITILPPNTPPVAVDDYYYFGCTPFEANILFNDYDPDGDNIYVLTQPVTFPTLGTVTISMDGTMNYSFERGTTGFDQFIYEICDDNYFPECDRATVYITIFTDTDCDGIPDEIDIDDDNDGIVDWDEGDLSRDSDGDGIPDSLDIDSDNDGIPDNIEAQAEGRPYIRPSGIDENQNGLDDIYEQDGNLGLTPVDTDGDGQPDYVDTDTDNDGVPDYIEGYDADANGIADVLPVGADDDGDGLDNAYDDFFGGFNENDLNNAYGAHPPLQDFDGDGIRDWRDVDDDNDGIPTIHEDLNNNGVWHDDDLDLDGHPEYLDAQDDCSLFIPEGFSPNDDGVHDYFQIYCMKKYPDAKLMIFTREGDLLYEHERYGNREFWGSFEASWWNGESIKNHQNGQHKVEPGVYMYILDLGNGDLERGFVMVSY